MELLPNLQLLHLPTRLLPSLKLPHPPMELLPSPQLPHPPTELQPNLKLPPPPMELLQSQLQPRLIAMELLPDVPMLLLATTVLHPNRLLLPLIAMELHPLQDISLKLLSLD